MTTEVSGYEKCHLIVTAHQNNCFKIVLESLWEIFRPVCFLDVLGLWRN